MSRGAWESNRKTRFPAAIAAVITSVAIPPLTAPRTYRFTRKSSSRRVTE